MAGAPPASVGAMLPSGSGSSDLPADVGFELGEHRYSALIAREVGKPAGCGPSCVAESRVRTMHSRGYGNGS